MEHRIGMAVVCLHISAVLYVLLAFGMTALFLALPGPNNDAFVLVLSAFTFLFCIALAVGLEIVVYGLQRRRFWAWIVGLIFFGLCLTSIFLPLGAFGLWGLLDEGSRRQFGVGSKSRQREYDDDDFEDEDSFNSGR